MQLAFLIQADAPVLLTNMATAGITGKYWVDGMLVGGSWQHASGDVPFGYTPGYYHTRLVGSGTCLAAKRTTSPAMTGYNNVDCDKKLNFICQF